jgi:hypothetical protein
MLQLPSKRPAYRLDRPHTEFLTDIASQLPATKRTPTAFCAALLQQMGTHFSTISGASPDHPGKDPMEAIERSDFCLLFDKLKQKYSSPEFLPRTYIMKELK